MTTNNGHYKDPFIRTKMTIQLDRINLIREICIDKKENVMMFCPKCLAIRGFRKVPNVDMVTGYSIIVYECGECKKKFVEDALNPNNKIERLIQINHLIAPYQTEFEVMEMKDELL